MQKTRPRPIFRDGIACLLLVVSLFSGPLLSAAEVRLKNGTTLRGTLLVMNTLAGRAVGLTEMKQIKDENPVPRNIGRIDNGWQRTYFPLQQRQVAGEALRFGEKEDLTIDWNRGSAKPRHGCGSPIIPTRQTDFATTDQQQTMY